MFSSRLKRLAGVGVAALTLVCLSRADDSAASIAAGGLVPRRETRIVMAKEVLQISPTNVIVDYDFRNDSDQDVTTEIAFPIPPYTNEFPEGEVAEQSFRSFRLWVDGKPTNYLPEAKASLGGKDVTEVLRANNIDIATLGHFEDRDAPATRDFARLPVAARKLLVKQGLFDDQGDGFPANPGDTVFAKWTVHLQYHWTQTFPAHSTIHIRHIYSPAVGFKQFSSMAINDYLQHPESNIANPKDKWETMSSLGGFCADRRFLTALATSLHKDELSEKGNDREFAAGVAEAQWVDFILTSANTWKQPIEDFTLIVERGKPLDGYGKPMTDRRRVISFCSPENAPVKRIDADRFEVHLTNFVPKAELHIGFFDFNVPTADSKAIPAK
jgi:Domain of unknown function (DUF4424)